jgi:hypothetical protein
MRHWKGIMAEAQGSTAGPAVRKPGESAAVTRVLSGIGDALSLVSRTEHAYRRRDQRAAELRAFLEGAHRHLLRSICDLSEEEADSVEPRFTELETRMLRLPGAPNDPSAGPRKR